MDHMALSMKQIINRHGAFVSGITGIAVVGALVAQEMVRTATNLFYAGAQGLPGIFGLSFGYALVRAVPFGIGFFLSLWLLAPIAEELRVPHVITRAILATGIGSTLTFVVTAVLAIIDSFSVTGPLFGNSFPMPGFDGGGAVQGLLSALAAAINGFASQLPLGVLAGILLWIWRKNHPPKRPLEGILDL